MKYDKQTQKNFDILHNLNWPTDEYRVFGGGIMSALGIKPWRDIDLIVSEDLYEWIKKEYKHDYWYSEETHLPIHFDSVPIELGPFPHSLEHNFPHLYNLDTFWDEYVMIENIPFILMRNTLMYKLHRKNSKFVQVEEKDKSDVDLITEYVKTNSFGF
jgi:hypothetical protein|tara:strand:- start:401 stop:874 length:474 start_codon:yes stop_codon:yes gene_type:complete